MIPNQLHALSRPETSSFDDPSSGFLVFSTPPFNLLNLCTSGTPPRHVDFTPPGCAFSHQYASQNPAAQHTNNLRQRGISDSTGPSLSTSGLLPGSCRSCRRCWRCWRRWGCWSRCGSGTTWRFVRRIWGVFPRLRWRGRSRL